MENDERPHVEIPEGVELLLAANPSLMTLTGTNSWVVPLEREQPRQRRRVAVIDPGPLLPDHVDRLRGVGTIEAIFLTHHHLDHAEAAGLLAAEFNAPVFAHRQALASPGAAVTDGQRLSLGDLTFEVLHTPGHTHDSICLLASVTPGGPRVMFTGDTLLGGSTSMISRPDGDLAEYLATLGRLSSFHGVTGLPGHGTVIRDIAGWASETRARREQRLELILAGWREVHDRFPTDDASKWVTEIARSVYRSGDGVVPEHLERMVRAHLRYLSVQGLIGGDRF